MAQREVSDHPLVRGCRYYILAHLTFVFIVWPWLSKATRDVLWSPFVLLSPSLLFAFAVAMPYNEQDPLAHRVKFGLVTSIVFTIIVLITWRQRLS